MVGLTAPFLTTLNDRHPDFKVTPLFDIEHLRNGPTTTTTTVYHSPMCTIENNKKEKNL